MAIPAAPASDAAQAAPAEQKAISYSYSRGSTFRECQYRYFLLYVAKTPSVPNGPRTLGVALHETFAFALNEYRDAHVALYGAELQEIARGFFENELDADDPDVKYIGVEERLRLDKRLLAIVQAFDGYMLAQRSRKKGVFAPKLVEQMFTIAHPRDSAITLRGTLDLITEPEEGKAVGVDWKTGRWFDKAAAQKTAQPESYYFGAAKMSQHAEHVEEGWRQLSSFVFVAFPYDEENASCRVETHIATRTGQQIKTFLDDVESFAREVRRLSDPTRDSFARNTSKACQRCEVLHACKAGQEFLAKQRITPKHNYLIPPPKRREPIGGRVIDVEVGAIFEESDV